MQKMELDQIMGAERIARLKSSIINEYVKTLLSDVQAASTVSRDGLIDSLPIFLDILQQGLKGNNKSEQSTLISDLGKEHGIVRARQKHFTIDDIFIEYRILSRVIFSHLRIEANLQPDLEDFITDAILRSIGNAVHAFTEFRDFDQQNGIHSQRNHLASILEHTQHEFEDFFMKSELPMFKTVGKNHRFTVVNKAFERLADRNLLGESLKSDASASEFVKSMDRIFENNEPEMKHHLSFIDHSDLNVYFYPYHDVHESVKGIMGIIERP